MIGTASAVLADQVIDELLTQQSVSREPHLGEQRAVQHVQLILQHIRQGGRKALFLAGQKLGGQIALGELDLDVAQRSSPHLEPRRQTRREFRHGVVHERASRLQPMRHRHSILNHYRMIGQTGLAIGVEHTVHDVRGLRPFIRVPHQPPGIEIALGLQQLGTVQIALELAPKIEVLQAPDIALSTMVERYAVQPFQLVSQALVPTAVGKKAEGPGHDLTPEGVG